MLSVHCHSVSADVLNSPLPEIPGKPLSLDELGKVQSNDGIIGPVYHAVATNMRPTRCEWGSWSNRSRQLCRQWEKLSIVDGVLCRKKSQGVQLVIPEKFHLLIFSEPCSFFLHGIDENCALGP